jgi:hypothetical protein
MPLPQSGPYEALEGIYPGRAGKKWGVGKIIVSLDKSKQSR